MPVVPVDLKRTSSLNGRDDRRKRCKTMPDDSTLSKVSTQSDSEDDQIASGFGMWEKAGGCYKHQGALVKISDKGSYYPARLIDYDTKFKRFTLLVCNGQKLKQPRDNFYTTDDPPFFTCKVSKEVAKYTSLIANFTDPVFHNQILSVLPEAKKSMNTSNRATKYKKKQFQELLKGLAMIMLDADRLELLKTTLLSELKADLKKILADSDHQKFVHLVLVPETYSLIQQRFGAGALSSSQEEKSAGEWAREILALRDTLNLGDKVRSER
ncbi:hypothetical protein HDU97_008426 [Phlyctochytrium planicorne]|nr:hypothetical protein HDU97_008426 [Phlyctochytrium planicorne]